MEPSKYKEWKKKGHNYWENDWRYQIWADYNNGRAMVNNGFEEYPMMVHGENEKS